MSTETESTLIALDPQIDNAMAQGDLATLERLLAPDFIYTHSNGNSQPKGEFIEAIGRRENRPQRPLSSQQAEIHDDVAVTRGNLNIIYNDDRPQLWFRYVRVWRLKDGGWRAISHRTLYAKDREPA